MRQAFNNLRIALGECGAEVRDVLKTTIYVSSSSRDDLVVAWNEVASGFGDHDPPSTLLGGSRLPGSACRDRGDCRRDTALTRRSRSGTPHHNVSNKRATTPNPQFEASS